MLLRRSLLALPVLLTAVHRVSAAERSIVVASTTSTNDSGLFGYILPLFKAKTGIEVKVISQGTGQALETARRGNADVVFVHAKGAEEQFLADGFGVKRYPVMYNDFILAGPKSDRAGVVRGSSGIAAALKTIKAKAQPFVSRGDSSGTHIAELNLWKLAGIDIAADKGRWYKDVGQGMGAALNTAAALDAYVLSDRGTWLAFKNKRDLTIVVQGYKRAFNLLGDWHLFNQYSVILVNPQKHPNVKKELGQQFIDWLISSEGQRAIAAYKIDGERLFYPDARDMSA